MEVLIGICVLLSLVLLILLFRLIVIKGELRTIREELILTGEQSYNRQLRVTLLDRDLTETAAQINRNLDYQKKLKLAAERAEVQLQQSISDIAHDLRTPLTVIKGNLQMLEQDISLTERGRERLRICQEKSDLLKEMVDDFFELSVLESDHGAVVLHDVDITNVLAQFILDHEAVIRAYDLEPELRLPEKSIFIQADEQMLVRMLGNLLNNIVKYAENTFQVQLDTVDEGRRCLIRFSNAVEHERQFDVAHLFDRSYRGDQARSGSGAGLGLYIVKLLADKQKAAVAARREGDELVIEMRFMCKACQKAVLSRQNG